MALAKVMGLGAHCQTMRMASFSTLFVFYAHALRAKAIVSDTSYSWNRLSGVPQLYQDNRSDFSSLWS